MPAKGTSYVIVLDILLSEVSFEIYITTLNILTFMITFSSIMKTFLIFNFLKFCN